MYVGSDKGKWGTYSASKSTPDKSDNNLILNNKFGPGITAERIDVKGGPQAPNHWQRIRRHRDYRKELRRLVD